MVLLCGRLHSHEDEEATEAEEGGNPPSVRRVVKQVQDYCFSSPRFKGKRRDGNAYRALLLMNLIEAAFICINGILVYEMSAKDLQENFTHTVVFPLYLPRAMGMAIAANHQGSVALGNFVGLYFSRAYMGIRAPESLGQGRLFAVLLFALIGTCELQIGAWFIKKLLCPSKNPMKKVPTFDNVGQAFWYIIIVFCTSLLFETLIAVAECCTRMVEWTYFFRYWATWWLGVLAAMLTVSPAVIHLMALGPLHLTFTRPTMKSSIKAVALWSVTLGFLILVFLFSVRTFIRPLPYLLFPLIISATFQFNRVGWSLIVAVSSLFCAVGTIHRDSSLYYMAGAPKSRASPSLVIQIELFTSVMGLVGIVLAAAVKEKNQLTRDLNRTNEDLEKTVKERTKELVKANEELQVSQKSAEHANHAKSEFLANMSHEIRTPIHGILGLTTLLLESKLTSDQKESLISLKECADLLLHIINSVLDLTKIEAGRLEIEKVPFSIRRLVSSTLRMLQTRAQDRGLQLLWEVEGGVPDLLIGDAGKLQQCLLNLVGNALKFTNQGKVTVRVALPKSKEPATDASMVSFRTSLVLEEDSVRLPLLSSQPVKQPTTFAKLRSWSSWPGAYFKVEPDKEIPAEVYDNVEEFGSSKIAPVTEIEERVESSSELPHSQPVQIEFEVKDTGIGITKDKLEDMFNPFTQGDPSTSRLYGGTGLGLCIVQRFVELLGGKIWADSVVGKGSTFVFKLPFPLSDKEASATSDHFIRRPLRFSSVENWPLSKASVKSGLLLHRRAYSLGVLLRGIKFSLPAHLAYNKEYSNEEDLFDPDSTGVPGNGASPGDESLRTTLGVIQVGSGLFRQKAFSDWELLHSKEEGISAGRGSRPAGSVSVGTMSRKRDSERPSSTRAGGSKLPKSPKLEQRVRNLTGQVAVHETSGAPLLNSSQLRNLSHPAEIPQKPTDVFILEKLRSMAPAPPGNQANTSSPPSQDQEVSPMNPVSVQMEDFVIDILEGKREGFLLGSDQHTEGVSGLSDCTEVPRSSDLVSKVAPNGASLVRNLSPSMGETSQDALQTEQKFIGSQKRPPKAVTPTKDSPDRQLKILLAEDNPINQKVAIRQLQKHGHIVTIVGDGKQALETVQSNHDAFDLVLMDVQMPNMDGLRATQLIREVEKQQGWSRLPILGLTAHAIQGYQETCLSHGMDGYLGKPFDIKQLLIQMTAILSSDKKVHRDEGLSPSEPQEEGLAISQASKSLTSTFLTTVLSQNMQLERILSSSNGELNLSAEDTALLSGCSIELNQIFTYQRRIHFL